MPSREHEVGVEPEATSQTDPIGAVVLLAGGSSARFGRDPAGRRKPLALLAGVSLLEHCIRACQASPRVGEIVVVAHAEDLEALRASYPVPQGSPVRDSNGDGPKLTAVIAGGAERSDSSRLGVQAVRGGWPVVAIHDAARPLVRAAQIDAVLEAAQSQGAALLALAARDTIKESDDGRRSTRTLDRERLWIAQTPQAFERERLLELLANAEAPRNADEARTVTDDASFWERHVGPVAIVPGDASNLKITGPEDLHVAEALLAARSCVRTTS